MNKLIAVTFAIFLFVMPNGAIAQDDEINASMYEIPPRWLVDMPTAGTLPRGYYNIGVRFYTGGGAIVKTDIGLSSRLTMGISYGAEEVISNQEPDWNPGLEFKVKFRLIDEMEYFPALTIGYNSQGNGAFSEQFDRYTFKSRGFFAVVSRSFYFYQWTSGWHAGVNYSLEHDVDGDKNINGFLGIDATFSYNLALTAEYDMALNDDRSDLPNGVDPNLFGGKGRGYFNIGIKWLFTENLELEANIKDILQNRRESSSVTREVRINYIDSF